MTSGYKFLLLPLAATLFNLILSLTFKKNSAVKAQDIPALQEAVNVNHLCAGDATGGSDGLCVASFAEDIAQSSPNVLLNNEDDEEEDPNLHKMPGYDFKAYVNPDIATFYREAPGTRVELTPKFTGQGGKFTNMSPEVLHLYWDSGRAGEGRFISHCGPWESCGTSTFPGHKFFFSRPSSPNDAICHFTMVQGTSAYFYDPFTDGNEPARCVSEEQESQRRSLEELSPEDLEMYSAHRLNLQFAKDYRDFTGQEWLTMYPRDPPRHKIWRADYLGQEHVVSTKETQFVRMPPPQDLPKVKMEELRRNETSDIALKEYRAAEPTMNFTLKTVSCAPRAFEIPNFLSETEVDHILDLVGQKTLHLSTTGESGSPKADVDTRTSKNTWIGRYSSPVTDAIYRRVADILRLDEALLRHRHADEYPELGTNQPISEDMQLVHYDVGEQYTAHHDFGYPDNKTPNSPSRSINVLMYLNEGMEGGETSFPRPRSAESNGSFDVIPKKGKAVIFYMVNPDGNLDDHSQHAALPIKKGEKWLSNLWIHDPIKD